MGVKDKIKPGADGDGVIGWILGSGRKKAMAAGAAAAIVVALVASIMLNGGNAGGYVTLLPRISREENNEILAVLGGKGVAAKRNDEGEATVPEDQLGDIMIEMSELGCPKTALPFDVSPDNMSFATAGFEKRQYLLMNFQDRLERILKDTAGIKSAIVTLNVPDESAYVWGGEDSGGTGSVSLTLMPSYDLSSEKVSAIKNLVADSVPRLAPERMAVVNAETMQGMASGDIGNTAYDLDRLDFETKAEERLQNKIKNVLTLAYSPDKIRVSATVVIDYDKMITENLECESQEDGQGVVDHYRESRGMVGGQIRAGGTAGEENDTDIPAYGTAETGGTTQGTGDYYRDVDYLINYIKKQTEKDNVKFQKVIVAIMANDDNLIESKKQQLIDAASKAANIAPEDIVVSSFRKVPKETAPAKLALPVQAPVDTGIDYRTIAIATGAGVLLFLLTLFLIFGRRRRRQMKEDQELSASFEGEVPPSANMEERAEEATVQNDLGHIQASPEDPVEQVRSFAQINPEIIAPMISSWLKKDKK